MLGAPPGATIRSRLAQVLLSRSPHSGHGRSWLAGQALLVGAVCEPPCFGRFMLPRDSSTVPRFLRVRWGGDGLFTNRPYLSGSVESQLIGRLGRRILHCRRPGAIESCFITRLGSSTVGSSNNHPTEASFVRLCTNN